MRWIIGIVTLTLLAVVGWFLFPRIAPVNAPDPLDILPEDTWLVMDANASAAHALFSDSTSLFRDLSIIESFQHVIINADQKLIEKNHRVIFFLYGSTEAPMLGVIESAKEKNALLRDFFTEHIYFGKYTMHSNELLNTTIRENSGLKKLLRATNNTEVSICAKPQRIIAYYSEQLAPELKLILAHEIVTEDWVGFDLRENANLFMANGIGSSKMDETGKKRDLNLLRYLPAKTGIAVLSSTDSAAFAMAYCPYSNEGEVEHENLFLLVSEKEPSTASSEDQSYQGIPISIGPLPSAMSLLGLAWNDEAYIARLGSVSIHAASFTQLTKLIDDYLADDKLISSPSFKHIEPAISDASFTFYMRPEMLFQKNPFITNDAELENINTLVFQSFSELPLQKFYALSIVHHAKFVDKASTLWRLLLDTTIAAGPWGFENHYTKENEVIIQDAKHQLYLVNKDGKTLWKQRLDAPIVGDVHMIDAYKSGKYQMLFNTTSSTYLLDRNGKNVGDFPLKLEGKTAVSPTIAQYDSKGDYRILIADGNSIRNVDVDGKAIKGWKNPTINGMAVSPIHYLNYAGKDYLTVITNANSIYFFDRAGSERIKKLQADTLAMALTLREGKSLNDCAFIGYDSIGNIHTTQIGKENRVQNILPLGSDVGLLVTDLIDHAFVTVKKDKVLSLNRDLDVKLDFLLPEELSKNIQILSSPKGWIGCESASNDHFYMLDLKGNMLDKMPLNGAGKALLLDVDKNGSQEVLIGDGKRELMVYKLAD